MLDIHYIRRGFPQLGDQNYHYLDSAASSLTPGAVLSALDHYYTNTRANVHRAFYTEALSATEYYENVRGAVARFINADLSEVIYTSGATGSSNMILRMIEGSPLLKDKMNIVTTEMEHHSSIIPLQELAKRTGLQLKHIPLLWAGLNYDRAEELITGETAIVSVMLASNVLGTINDVRRIADMAHRHGAIMIVDATAAMGHIPVDVQALGADVIFFSGHKMFAPTGAGILWVKMALLKDLPPSQFGGHMILRADKDTAEWDDIPQRFEAGTKNIAGIIGLGVAIDQLHKIGLKSIHEHVSALVADATARLETIPGIRVFSEHDSHKNAGSVSFVADWAHSHDIAEILARDRVAVRPGHHCAMPLHNAIGVSSTTRASFHVYNTREDIDALIEGVDKAREIFI